MTIKSTITSTFILCIGFPVDIFAEIYLSVLPGLNETESIMDKRQLCIRAINAIHSIVNATHTKTLRFKNHNTIEDTRCKLIAIYNPLRHFSHLYLPGYEISNSHETTSFSMNYREYHQRELYLLLNDIYWVSQNIKVKYVFNCIEYKKLDLLAKICTKVSKILQKWALGYNLYLWHESY